MSINRKNIEERAKSISKLMEDFFAESSKARIDNDLQKQLDIVFSSPVWGFREILLVITIARILEPSYKASNAFYKCNPRALFEGPIRKTLAAYHIPHKKSGPLNVAKAAVGINRAWAKQRRPANIAQAVVYLVKVIESLNKQQLAEFAKALHYKFLQEASRVASLVVDSDPVVNPIYLSNLCRSLIEQVPDAGNTPQRIIGLLLDCYHSGYTKIKISGHEDRASVTSTTSKKPGDILEEDQAGKALAVYEITVKPFSMPRMTESYEAIKTYNEINGSNIQEVQVICRAEDVDDVLAGNRENDILLGEVDFQDISFYFIEIFQWIKMQLLKIPQDARRSFFKRLHSYVNDPNTAEKVKVFWKEQVPKLL